MFIVSKHEQRSIMTGRLIFSVWKSGETFSCMKFQQILQIFNILAEQKLFFENDLCLASLLQVIFYSKHKFCSFYKSLSGAYLEIKP